MQHLHHHGITGTHQRGQGMVEYIIIVALIALAAIGAFTYFGDTVRGQTVQMTNQVAGTNDDTGSDEATTAAEDSQDEAGHNTDLSNYSDRDSL